MADFDRDAMLEMFIFEMNQYIEQLEQIIVQSETGYNAEQINEIFRIMHTIKGSAAMMLFENIEKMAHSVEDLFFYLREESPKNIDYPTLSDHVLSGADFIKAELAKIQDGATPDGDASDLINTIKQFLQNLKNASGIAQSAKNAASVSHTEAKTPTLSVPAASTIPVKHKYKAKILFELGCEMENIRAYTLIHNFGEMAEDIKHYPVDVIDDEAIHIIRENGFIIEFNSAQPYQVIYDHLMQTVYLRDLMLEEITSEPTTGTVLSTSQTAANDDTKGHLAEGDVRLTETKNTQLSSIVEESHPNKKTSSPVQNVINVSVSKLDALLNLMGELVIAEAMVTQNSELAGLQLDSFHKDARQLVKIIGNLREVVMAMRLVPLSSTFFRMHRVVRDICRQLNKDVQLDIVGEETEVDKKIIEHIADPLTHIIRNSLDHGIEMPEERRRLGKPEKGRILLEAKNSGGDVLIIIKDDGAGLNRDKILQKAKDSGLLRKPESEYTDKEIHQFIFLPGFSTNTQVTALSGRGVGMDVVSSNLEMVSGTVLVESTPGEGSTFTLKIPLTLAIIEGMTVLMAGVMYTIPIVNIIKSFKVTNKDSLFTDPDGNEMITERGEIYNIVRLHEFFNVEGAITNIEDGILIMLENGDETICLLVDDLIGKQQAVAKPLPKYFKKVRGISNCTLLGNGGISLIIDVPGFFDK